MTTEIQYTAEGDDMLEPLIYAAIMHNGKPKTIGDFVKAAANVADMLKRRAAFQTQPKGTERVSPEQWQALIEAARTQGIAEGRQQAPAPVDEEPTAFVHWPLNGQPRLVWYSNKALHDAIERGNKAQNGYVPDLKLYAHAQAPAVAHRPQHPKQIACVGCALCGRNEAGYYCTGDCGEYQDAASQPPVQPMGDANG